MQESKKGDDDYQDVGGEDDSMDEATAKFFAKKEAHTSEEQSKFKEQPTLESVNSISEDPKSITSGNTMLREVVSRIDITSLERRIRRLEIVNPSQIPVLPSSEVLTDFHKIDSMNYRAGRMIGLTEDVCMNFDACQFN